MTLNRTCTMRKFLGSTVSDSPMNKSLGPEAAMLIGGTDMKRNCEILAALIGLTILGIFAMPMPAYSAPSASVINYGDCIPDSIEVVTDIDEFQFDGGIGDKIIIRMQKTTGDLYPVIELYDNNMNLLRSDSGSPQAYIFDYTLPFGDAFIIRVRDSNNDDTGNYWLSLECRQDVRDNGVDIGYDTLIPGKEVAYYGEMDGYRFTGSAGNKIIIRMNKISGDLYPVIELFDPSMNEIRSDSGSPQAYIEDYVLPVTGEYVIYARDSNADDTGFYWLSLQCRQQVRDSGPDIDYDTLIPSDEVENYGDMDAYKFLGAAGDKIIVRLNKISGDVYPVIELFDPSMNEIRSDSGSPQAYIEDFVLPVTGQYTIYTRDSNGDDTGYYWLSLKSRQYAHGWGTPVTCSASYPSESIEAYGDIDAFVLLPCVAGSALNISMDKVGGDLYPKLELFDRTFNRLVYDTGSPRAEITNYVCTYDGIVIIYASDSSGDDTGLYNLTIDCNCEPPTSVSFSDVTRPKLGPCFPSPSTGSTTIDFESPRFIGNAQLAIYDIRGQMLRLLHNGSADKGRHVVNWNGMDERGRQCPAGVYFYRLTAGPYTETRRMVLLR
jgi:hypothetical protein